MPAHHDHYGASGKIDKFTYEYDALQAKTTVTVMWWLKVWCAAYLPTQLNGVAGDQGGFTTVR
jgi:hypothetical protein